MTVGAVGLDQLLGVRVAVVEIEGERHRTRVRRKLDDDPVGGIAARQNVAERAFRLDPSPRSDGQSNTAGSVFGAGWAGARRLV